MEEYRKVIGFENYEVSDFGNIRNIKQKVLKPCKFKNSDYYYVDLCSLGKKYRHLVHRVVMMTFTTNESIKPQVNHINGIKSDNRLSNLEWNTNSENQINSIRTGLRDTIGEKNSQSKLTPLMVLDIFKDKRSSGLIYKDYCIAQSTVCDIKAGRSWTHITGMKKLRPSKTIH